MSTYKSNTRRISCILFWFSAWTTKLQVGSVGDKLGRLAVSLGLAKSVLFLATACSLIHLLSLGSSFDLSSLTSSAARGCGLGATSAAGDTCLRLAGLSGRSSFTLLSDLEGCWKDSAESSAEDTDRECSCVDELLSDDGETVIVVAFLGFPVVDVDAVRLADAKESVPCFSEDLVGAMARVWWSSQKSKPTSFLFWDSEPSLNTRCHCACQICQRTSFVAFLHSMRKK
jgi:hypothetical protein